jgi:hypothetical protein
MSGQMEVGPIEGKVHEQEQKLPRKRFRTVLGDVQVLSEGDAPLKNLQKISQKCVGLSPALLREEDLAILDQALELGKTVKNQALHPGKRPPSSEHYDERIKQAVDAVLQIKDNLMKSEQSDLVMRMEAKTLEWLSEMQEKKGYLHLYQLSDIHQKRGDYTASFNALYRLTGLISPSMQGALYEIGKSGSKDKLIAFHQEIFAGVEAVRNWTELRESIQILDKALNEQVSPEESARVQSLLSFAVGNEALNRKLHHKKEKTAAEWMLFSLSGATAGDRAFPPILDRVDSTMAGAHTTEFLNDISKQKETAEDMEQSVSDLRTELVEAELDLAIQTQVREDVAKLDALLEKLAYTPSVATANQLFSQERLRVLGQLQALLHSIGETIALSIPPATEEAQPNLEGLQKSIQACEESVGKVRNQGSQLIRRLEELDLRCSNPTYVPPFSLRDYCLVYRLQKLNIKIEKLEKNGVPFANEPLLSLKGNVQRAKRVEDHLSSLFGSLPTYTTGDVLITDEARDSAFEGTPQVSLWRVPFVFIKEWKETGVFQEAVWPIRGAFCDGRLHASHVHTENSVPLLQEMGEKFSESKIPFLQGALNLLYRPSFLNQLTPEGKRVLQSSGMADEAIEKMLFEIYAQCSSEYKEINKPYFDTLVEQGKRAFSTFIKSKTLLPAQAVFTKAVDSVSGLVFRGEKAERPLRPFVPATPLEVAQHNGVLCAELVAKILSDLASIMNEKLNAKMNESNPEARRVEFLKPVIPGYASFSSIRPDALETMLVQSGSFTRLPEPVAVRLFVDLNPHRP